MFNYNSTDSSAGHNNNNNNAAPDHNLDLSLGNSSASKQSSNNRDNPPQSSGSVQFQGDWRQQGLRPKVHSYFESNLEREREILLIIICQQQQQVNLVDVENNSTRRGDGCSEAETLQLLSQTHLHSPNSFNNKAREIHNKYGQFPKPTDSSSAHIVEMFSSPFGSSNNYRVIFSFFFVCV